MQFAEIAIDFVENASDEVMRPYPLIRLLPGAKIIRSKIQGPLYLSRNAQLGPDVTIGKYSGMNENTYLARARMGAYCSIGARTAINPFNHPVEWLSIHEFQYHPKSYDWSPEWNDFQRLERTPDMFDRTVIGNDVWMGHNVNVLGGVTIGDGAIIGA